MKYRKLPVVIDAIRFEYTKEGIQKLRDFVGVHLGDVTKHRHPDAKGEAIIETLEDGTDFRGIHVATEGDYIIKGVKGEFYPCKPDIFLQTYEYVGE